MKQLIFIFMVLISFSAIGQEKKAVWDYPVKPGSDEWKKLQTIEEQFNAYNIPQDIIKDISTEELVKTCLSYPEWGLIHAYNDRLTGFSVIVSLFNGFRELFERKDAVTELLNAYNKIDPLNVSSDWTDLQKGRYCFQFEKIEMFLSQKPMINKLDKDNIRNLRDIAVAKYRKKKMLPQVYSLWDLSPTVGICLNIIEKYNSENVEGIPEIKIFKHNLMSNEIQVLDTIVDLSEKIIL